MADEHDDILLDAAWRRQIDICRRTGIPVIDHGTDTKMDWLWLSAGEGAPWRRMDIDDWHRDGIRWSAGNTLYGNDTAMLAALADIRDRSAPRAWLYVGPGLEVYGHHWPDMAPWIRPDGTACDWGAMRRYGEYAGWCGDSRVSIMIALCGTVPLRTMHHEVLHHVWRHLTWQEQAILEDYGDTLRDRGTPTDVRDPEWWMRPEEAEARAYELWSCRLPQPHRAVPPAEVIAIWRQIASGHIGRR